MLPTLSSDDFDVIERGIAAVRGAITISIPGILGIHIEGPFLNVEKKGINDDTNIRTRDKRAVKLMSSLGLGTTPVTQIGRETGRERECQSEPIQIGAVTLKKTQE